MPPLTDRQDRALEAMRRALGSAGSRDAFLREAVRLVREASQAYHWTGIYLLEGDTLVLHSYLGRPTPHERIPLDRGVCGAAARENATILVPDVRQDPRYLACSIETRSEAVVPLRHGGKVVGELDLDSDLPGAFGEADREFLESAAGIVSQAFSLPPAPPASS